MSSREISLTKPTSNKVIVPIFNNGTQTIRFTVEWEDGVHAQDWITINSLLVVKCIDIQIAEYMKWTIVNKTTGTITNYSYVVTSIIEDIIANITFTKDYINNNIKISRQGWILLNLFNSYVEDSSDESWKDKHFYFLESISDNIVPAYNWNIVLEYKSLDIWGNYQALSFVAENNQAKFVYNRSVICVIFDWESPAITGELSISNMIPPAELRKPLIFGPSDMELYETETSREIVWLVEDEHPSIYHLHRNGTVVDSRIWSNRSIQVILDFLLLGVNNLTIHVFDKYNNSQIDTVFIKVLNVEDPPLVTLVSPIGGETLEGIVDIRWKATDPDGDTLIFSLFVFNGEK